MKQICIMVFLFLFFSQEASGYTVKTLRQMCKSGCQSVTPNRKDLSSAKQRIVCNEFTRACRMLQRIDRENGLGDQEAHFRHPANNKRRNKKVVQSIRKGRKADHSNGGLAVSTVGNAVAMATNGHKTIQVKGHNRPQVATFGSGKAIATDGKISDYSSHGINLGKAKHLKKDNEIFEKILKRKYGKIDEEGSSEESGEVDTSSAEVKKEEADSDSSYENSREESRAHSDEGDDDFSEQLRKQHEMFTKKIEDQNAKIMKGIMNKLGM